jgi:hypothetical protein
MYDKEMAEESMTTMKQMPDGSFSIFLNEEERVNLLDMIDDFIISQGWNLKDFIEGDEDEMPTV